MIKPLIISFASKGREDYLKMAENLYRSVKEHWKYDYLFYTMDGNRNEFEGMKITQINNIPQPSQWPCDTHSVTPYQFKFGMIDHAKELGYDKIIWCDSSISLSRGPLHLLDESNKGVMAFHNLGHETIDYISDDCIEAINSNIEEVKASKQTWGGCIGFDFTKETAISIFYQIIAASLNGAFNEGTSNREGFKAHRHDQSVMSVLFHRNGVKLYDYGNIVCNVHAKEPFEYGNNFTFIYGKY